LLAFPLRSRLVKWQTVFKSRKNSQAFTLNPSLLSRFQLTRQPVQSQRDASFLAIASCSKAANGSL
jgi:hypothetical protein